MVLRDAGKLSPADHGPLVAMQQIADWLKKLGMSEYAQRFAENDIDASVLPELTDQDLKDVGVSLGHRRKCFARPRFEQRFGFQYGTRRARGARANSARRRRASSAHGNVHRPCWLHCALDEA